MTNKTKNSLKIIFLFLGLFLSNLLVFKVLSLLGFPIDMTALSYIVPPLCATIVLLLLGKR
ncbi:hypothetical protein ACVR1I_07940 [Streptococcus cameli]